jgi:hypothetical protein
MPVQHLHNIKKIKGIVSAVLPSCPIEKPMTLTNFRRRKFTTPGWNLRPDVKTFMIITIEPARFGHSVRFLQ